MFIRKLFKIGDKAKWLVLELLIVFVGVYMAFLFQSYAEDRKIDQEKDKVLTALKYELESFRAILPGRSKFMKNQLDPLMALTRKNEYSNFSNWFFLEPQYDFQIIEYALSLENNNIIDFEVYDELTAVYGAIKRLEHAERLIMEMSQRYVPIESQLSKQGKQVSLERATNLENFKRFVSFMSMRVTSLQGVADKSTVCLELINESMSPERRIEIETDLIQNNIGIFKTLEDAQESVQALFPSFSLEEIKVLYEESKAN